MFLNFETGLADWIDVKEFRCVPRDLDPSQALELLLAHARFRDTYVSGDSQEVDSVDLHGPYWLKELSSERYEPVAAREVDCALRDFAMRYSSEDEGRLRLARYEDEVAPLLIDATDWLRLAALPEEAQHEFGWVLEDFIEFVVHDGASGRLLLIVAAAD